MKEAQQLNTLEAIKAFIKANMSEFNLQASCAAALMTATAFWQN